MHTKFSNQSLIAHKSVRHLLFCARLSILSGRLDDCIAEHDRNGYAQTTPVMLTWVRAQVRPEGVGSLCTREKARLGNNLHSEVQMPSYIHRQIFYCSKGQGTVEVDEIFILLQLHPEPWVGIDDRPLLLHILYSLSQFQVPSSH